MINSKKDEEVSEFSTLMKNAFDEIRDIKKNWEKKGVFRKVYDIQQENMSQDPDVELIEEKIRETNEVIPMIPEVKDIAECKYIQTERKSRAAKNAGDCNSSPVMYYIVGGFAVAVGLGILARKVANMMRVKNVDEE